MIEEDLRIITGKIVSGNCTKVVAELFKDSEYKKDLLAYIPMCANEKVISKLKEVKYATKHNKNKNTSDVSTCGFSIERWLSNH